MLLVNIGDIHSMKNKPHYEATRSFFKYLLNSDIHQSSTVLNFLGDIVHYAIAEPSVVALWLEFVKDWTGQISILTGNHDVSATKQETFLDIFAHSPNVTIYKEKAEVTYDNISSLMLPFYRVSPGSNVEPMEIAYSKVEGDYDYIHLHAEVAPLFSSGIKLSENLHGLVRNGHIHTGSKCGMYLPSVNPTSTTEKDVETYIEIIDCTTKEVEIRYIPRFLNYAKVVFPEKLPKLDKDQGKVWLIDVYEGLSRKDILSHYDFTDNVFLHKVYKKSYIKDKDAEMYRSSKVQTKTRLEFLMELASNKQYDEELVNYVKQFIN